MANTDFTTTSPSDGAQANTECLPEAPPFDAPGDSPPPADPQSPQPEEASLQGPFKPRQLKISSLPLTHESAPFLRLSGKWLEEAGFHIGREVQVTVASECLVVRPHSRPSQPTKSQIREARRAELEEIANRSSPGTPADLYPCLGTFEGVCDAADGSDLLTVPSYKDAAATDPQPSDPPSTGKVRGLTATRGTWPERISVSLKPALGDVLSHECSRLALSPWTIAQHAQVKESRYRAFDQGDSEPNLSTFIAIAWTLDQDPRDLLDKLLLQIGLKRGTRPVLTPQRR